MLALILFVLAIFNLMVCGWIFGVTLGRIIGEYLSCKLGHTIKWKNIDTGETGESFLKGEAAFSFFRMIEEAKRTALIKHQGGPY